MENLTYEDIEVLLESVEVWEKQPASSGMIGSLLGMMLVKDEDERKRVTEDQMKEGREESKKRNHREILLKAKLVTLQSKLAAQEITDGFSA